MLQQQLPLSGLRVLDVGEAIAGPFCARLLAGLGAEVIKVEPPGTGDPARRRGPFRAGASLGESGPLHLYVNAGKRGVTLNLRTTSGRALFLRLVEQSDIVVESLQTRALAELGLTFDALSAVRPSLVLTSVSPFGDAGPYRDFEATELTLFALGGHMYKSGVLGRPPLRMGGWPAQYLAGIYAAFASLVASRSSEANGVGQHVTVCTFESQVTSHAQAMVEISYYGAETNADAGRGASGIRGLATLDGVAMLSAQEQQMERLAELVNAPPGSGRADPMNPAESRRRMNEYTTTWAAQHTKREVYELGQAMHIPASYPANPADLLDSPQYQYRGFIEQVEHPDAGTVMIPGIPFRWEDALAPSRPAPRLGEGNRDVLGTLLGLDPGQLSQLSAAGVI